MIHFPFKKKEQETVKYSSNVLTASINGLSVVVQRSRHMDSDPEWRNCPVCHPQRTPMGWSIIRLFKASYLKSR